MKILHVFNILFVPKSFFDGQFRYMVEHGMETHVVCDSAEDPEFSRKNKIIYHQISIARKITPFLDLYSIYKLIKLIRNEKFDIVVGHTPKGAMVAMIAAKIANVKSRIYYRHGLIYTTANGFKRFILKRIEQVTAALSTHIINVSKSLSDLAVSDHLNSAKKQLIIGAGSCGGIDTINIFNPELVSNSDIETLKNKLSIKQNDLIIGFCGRICNEKGIRELIDGFNKFKKIQSNSKLLLVGPFDSRDILNEHYKKEIENNPDIIYAGMIEKSSLPIYYSIMDIFVFPSYREGLGMCVLEASAMKIPILVSRSHGCVDSILEHVSGEYIEISPEGVCGGLEKMMNPAVRIRLGNGGRKFVVEKFDYKTFWPQIVRMYQSMVEQNNK